ncbi:craniofacial development protein 2-like [Wyeomyia smithii]|uniref:craniofacial development protein 2-like n=1 Tax=Wyeomyia smithii TaxID=174621 RepID=UPI00246815AA|nr:craniofacial development protein 2-like [Wyeomyia smithii]XP_055534873.1 craniofacial development protein 2-like [Wyeomyia smithii]XP_055534874.1 craniofacial development protein 2-like [Wyeomyia smithii]
MCGHRAQYYQSGGTTNERGTGFIVLGKMQSRVIKWQAIIDRMCVLRIKGRFYNYSIINMHCPHEGRPDGEKEAFYAQLEDVYDGCSQRDIKIVIGGMNAQIGREDLYKPVIGHESLHTETNNNGQRCVNFAASRGMVVRSTFFPRKDIHKATWKSPDQQTTNQIDHVLIEGRFFSDITNIRTYRGVDIDSDHYLVAVCMNSKLSTVYQPRQSRSPRLNIKQLRDPQAAEVYAQQLEAALPTAEELGAASLENGWTMIRTAIRESATTTLGTEAPSVRNDWYDGECQAAVSEKNRTWVNYLRVRTRENLVKYRRARNDMTTILRRKKRQQEDRDHEELEELFTANETRKVYEKVNQSRKGYVPRADFCKDMAGNLITNDSEVVDRWKQHFDEHLNGDATNGSGTGTDLGVPAVDDRVLAPDLHEIQREIGRLKNNKATGKDGLPGELYKHGKETLARELHWVISKIWEEEKLPE